jgi:hypothetical protein
MKRTLSISSLAALLLILLVPGLAHAKKFIIDTDPVAEGRVFVNGEFAGVASVEVDLRLRKDEVVTVTAEKEGCVSFWRTRFDKTYKGVVKVRLEEDEAFNATETSDVANTWLTVKPRAGAATTEDEDAIWQEIVSVVTDNFSDLEQMDRGSYYLRTAWRVREFNHRVVRNRLVVKRGVGDIFSIKIQLESQVARKKRGSTVGDDDFKPYERVFSKDKETIDFLRDQL